MIVFPLTKYAQSSLDSLGLRGCPRRWQAAIANLSLSAFAALSPLAWAGDSSEATFSKGEFVIGLSASERREGLRLPTEPILQPDLPGIPEVFPEEEVIEELPALLVTGGLEVDRYGESTDSRVVALLEGEMALKMAVEREAKDEAAKTDFWHAPFWKLLPKMRSSSDEADPFMNPSYYLGGQTGESTSGFSPNP